MNAKTGLGQLKIDSVIVFISRRLGGCCSYLTGDLKGWVKLNFKDEVGSCYGAYPESLIKIGHALAENA